MLEYEFEKIRVTKGFFVGKSEEHREMILRYAAKGWRYAGWIPASQANGEILEIDLVFQREREEPNEAGED